MDSIASVFPPLIMLEVTFRVARHRWVSNKINMLKIVVVVGVGDRWSSGGVQR